MSCENPGVFFVNEFSGLVCSLINKTVPEFELLCSRFEAECRSYLGMHTIVLVCVCVYVKLPV